MRSLIRRIRALFCPHHGPQDRCFIRVTADTAQAQAALARLRLDIEQAAALCDERRIKCDMTITITSEVRS